MCLCSDLPTVPTRTQVVVLQHPHESKHPFGTARFVKAKRGSKTEHGDEDVEIWTPGALGDRVASPKRLRKAVREAQSLAERSAKRAGDAPVEF